MLKYMSILYYRVSLLVHNLQKELEIDIVKGKGIAGFRAFYLVVGFGFFFFLIVQACLALTILLPQPLKSVEIVAVHHHTQHMFIVCSFKKNRINVTNL